MASESPLFHSRRVRVLFLSQTLCASTTDSVLWKARQSYGTDTDVDGDYIIGIPGTFKFVNFMDSFWNKKSASFMIQRTENGLGDWIVVATFYDNDGGPDIILWKCPHSSSFPTVPSDGWVPVHCTAKTVPAPKFQVKRG